jgi:hypothetical protein
VRRFYQTKMFHNGRYAVTRRLPGPTLSGCESWIATAMTCDLDQEMARRSRRRILGGQRADRRRRCLCRRAGLRPWGAQGT